MGLEAIFTPKQFILTDSLNFLANFPFELDFDILKRFYNYFSISVTPNSTISLQSTVRYKTARTKFLKGDVTTGKKYLFHSLRYRIFATHAAQNVRKFMEISYIKGKNH